MTRKRKSQTWSKYSDYDVEVDRRQGDKAREIVLCSFARPHMRAFHCSWAGFFTAFFVWFAIAPLLSHIKDDLGLTKKQIWTSAIASVGGTILVRFIVGPLCDKYGPRTPFAFMLCAAAIPTACTGLVQSADGLVILRAFIGIAGGTFVTCQDWTSRMFAKEVVGSANALAAGWGNLGAAVTQIGVGSILYPIFKLIYSGDTEMAWRTVCIVPAVGAFVLGILIYFYSDDCPKGNFSERKEQGGMHEVSALASFKSASVDFNSWILFIQYACCFGVELTMNNAAAMYFEDEFDLEPQSAVVVATIFTWMNLFARGLGGFASDAANESKGMRGRLLVQTIFLIGEGAFVIIFAHTDSLVASIMVVLVFSLFVQACEGTTYGIVPYVNKHYTGSVSGIVGAGGNVGAVCFGLCFRELAYKQAFHIMGISIFISAFLSIFINIHGHSRLLGGADSHVEPDIGEAPHRRSTAAGESAPTTEIDVVA